MYGIGRGCLLPPGPPPQRGRGRVPEAMLLLSTYYNGIRQLLDS